MPKKKSWVSRMKSKVQRRFRARQRMEKETAKKKRYAKHYAEAGSKHAMTYAEWSKKGEEQVYFKGAGGRKKTVEVQLREARVTPRRK